MFVRSIPTVASSFFVLYDHSTSMAEALAQQGRALTVALRKQDIVDQLRLCLQASALCACWLGVSMGQVGISIVHDVNHGSGLSSATSRYVLGAIVDLVRIQLQYFCHDVLHCCYALMRPFPSSLACVWKTVERASCMPCMQTILVAKTLKVSQSGDEVSGGWRQIGVSSFMWRQQHVVGHHAYTNLACDPDIRVSEHDVRRVAPHHPKQPYHVRQFPTIVLHGIVAGMQKSISSIPAQSW